MSDIKTILVNDEIVPVDKFDENVQRAIAKLGRTNNDVVFIKDELTPDEVKILLKLDLINEKQAKRRLNSAKRVAFTV